MPKGSAEDYITQDGVFAFLNTTYEDLNGERLKVPDFLTGERELKFELVPAVSPIYTVNDQDGLLLTYCKSN